MYKLSKNQNGFSLIEILYVVAVLVLLIIAGLLINSTRHKTAKVATTTNSTSTSTVKAASPIIGNGTYYDDSSEPRYGLTVVAGDNGNISGKLVFHEDGNQLQIFTYTADAYGSPFTMTTSPAMNTQVTAITSDNELTLDNCQQYLQFIEGSATCNFVTQ